MNVPQGDHLEPIQAFLRWELSPETIRHGTTGQKNDETRPYITVTALEAYFATPDSIKSVLAALFTEGNPPNAYDVWSRYRRVLAILLSSSNGRMIGQFVGHPRLQDRGLPFESEPPNFPKTSKGNTIWSSFYRQQWKFCPYDLHFNMTDTLVDDYILPFQVEEALGRGGSALQHIKTTRLETLLTFAQADNPQQAPTFALKTYRGREAGEYYTAEQRAFESVNRGKQPPQNIIGYHGSFRRKNTYNLILEYANKGNLEDFMRQNPPPSTGQEIILLWERLFELYLGLVVIHHPEPGLDQVHGYHQDINPKNILVKSQGGSTIYDCKFVLADLGLSHFKAVDPAEPDATDWDNFGTHAYGAPETFRLRGLKLSNLNVKRQVDIWSMACVFSEITTWIGSGWTMVEEYRSRRQREIKRKWNDLEDGDMFHDGEKLLNAVRDSHSNFIQFRRESDFITQRVLHEVIVDCFDKTPAHRSEAQALWGRAQRILEEARLNLKNWHGSHAQDPPSITRLQVLKKLPELESPPFRELPPTHEVLDHEAPQTAPPEDLSKNTGQRAPQDRHRTPPNPPRMSLATVIEWRKKRKLNIKDAELPDAYLLEDLRNRDHAFLIDNSASMFEHKREAKKLLTAISYLVKNYDPDGVDLMFTQTSGGLRSEKGTTKLFEMLEDTQFMGITDMQLKLGNILNAYKSKITGQQNSMLARRKILGSQKVARPLSLYIFTDGVWLPGSDAEEPVRSMVATLKEHGLMQKQVGIQFIRFGHHVEAIRMLNHLDSDLDLGIHLVDTEPSDGNIWKMLLGSIDIWFGYDQLPVDKSREVFLQQTELTNTTVPNEPYLTQFHQHSPEPDIPTHVRNYIKVGQGQQALWRAEGVVDARTKTLGEEHPDTLRSTTLSYPKTNLGYPLQPPMTLSDALESRDIRAVQHLLMIDFETAATSEFTWLHELNEAGYTVREIAELLLEDINDSPWIHFTPQEHTKFPVRIKFHLPNCAHQISLNTKQPSILQSEKSLSFSPPLHSDVRRLVEELCGVGGVAPSSKDVRTWHGNVTFEEQSSVSVITYAADSAVTQQSRTDLLGTISTVLTNFLNAAAAVQHAGLCCDSFTFLLRKQSDLELHRVDFHHALTMSSNVNVVIQNDSTGVAVQECVEQAEYILRALGTPIPNLIPNADLHYCALAAQFLCSAFLSYIQAHIGSIDPFFLDEPQRKMILLGSQRVPGAFAIKAELVELTCLAEMIQQPVLAFSLVPTNWERGLESATSRHDVLTNIANCLDTWGPGYCIYDNAHPSNIYAVALGSGFVSLVDSKTSRFHWAKGQLSESAASAAFDIKTMMRIGIGLSINKNCCIDEAVYRKSSFSALEPLGTHGHFWEIQEREAGLHGGQYLIGTYSQTWGKIPGTTLKQQTLRQANFRLIPFLEQSWGLQVSFCTSVARRVSLRELVTDLLPYFVNPLEQESWQELVNRHDIFHAFIHGNLVNWLRNLSDVLQLYVLTLVRTILEQLQHTGLDRDRTTLVIAWPQEGDIGRGLKIPCKAETHWAQVIADAEDCATFAYVTSRCLETNHIKCQGNLRAWRNTSKMLVTEMSPSGLEGQPLAATNATITTTSALPVETTTAGPTTQWKLEDQKVYYIKKLDSLLRVKVERPNSASSDVTHLVVSVSGIPQGLWKRWLLREEERRSRRIRERQAIGDYAEIVVVRTGLIEAQRR
ncbi:uncharacterized protein KY384_002749 [Bacidia gigantensis]|uniref:uncharacterized protein n=1 Tax=Bacidia gigantensis TaxID=2732470 RepID=UPI001D058D26|nr:uncharacterized protein KY384_002749 [Bacidia gigantensis]KAG8532871.1 hypothetical protein KY384_002749 [Bacidia gigantensis]